MWSVQAWINGLIEEGMLPPSPNLVKDSLEVKSALLANRIDQHTFRQNKPLAVMVTVVRSHSSVKCLSENS
jgi:hypothetical protein